MRSHTGRPDGFTLVEVLVSIAILALVLTTFLALRTNAIVDAANARDWRIAREIAERRLSELAAGAREFPPERGDVRQDEDYPDFEWQILVGESQISEYESELQTQQESYMSTSEEQVDRSSWQREREQLRRARTQGLTMSEYESQLNTDDEELDPSPDEFQDVAVIVTFPNLAEGEDQPPFLSLTLKARLSTLVIQGLTPEQAEQIRDQNNPTAPTGN